MVGNACQATGPQCVQGAACSGGDPSYPVATCVALGVATEGDPCDDSLGPRCTAGTSCAGGICRGGQTQGTACVTALDCASGLQCVPDPADGGATAHECDPLGGPRDPCTLDSYSLGTCQAGLHCDSHMQCTTGAANGAACVASIDCVDGSVCSATNVCTTAPGAGAPCVNEMCAGTLLCEEFDGQEACRNEDPFGAAVPGAACATSSLAIGCAVGECPAVDSDATCPTMVDDGAPCGAPGTTCLTFSTCVNGTCTWQPALVCH